MTDAPRDQYLIPPEEMPDWMRPRRRQWDWALLGILALSLLLHWPLLVREGIPANQGAQLEGYRLAAVAQHIEDGDPYPRWAMDFNQGYGSPVFHYLTPLPHMLGGWHHVIIQSPTANNLRFILMLGIVANGLGMLGWARQRWGTASGVLMASVWLTSPLLVRDVYRQTDVGVVLAFATLSLTLWALERLWQDGHGRDVGLAGLGCAALLLSENSLAIALWLGVMGWLVVNNVRYRHTYFLKRAWGSLILGTLLTAFYYVPAFYELDLVVYYPRATPTTWGALHGFDGLSMAHGWMLVAFGACAGLAWWMRHIQATPRQWLMSGGLVLVAQLALFWHIPALQTNLPPHAEFERTSGIYSTMPNGDLLPQAVKLFPPPNPAFELVQNTSQVVTQGGQVIYQDNTGTQRHFIVQSAQNSELVLNIYEFAGWELRRNDRTSLINLRPQAETGLLTANLPSGNYTWHLQFASTQIRQWSWGVSALALVMLALFSYGLKGRPTTPASA